MQVVEVNNADVRGKESEDPTALVVREDKENEEADEEADEVGDDEDEEGLNKSGRFVVVVVVYSLLLVFFFLRSLSVMARVCLYTGFV